MLVKFIVAFIVLLCASFVIGQHHVDGSFDSEEFEVGIDGPKQHFSSDQPFRPANRERMIQETVQPTEHVSTVSPKKMVEKTFDLEHSISGGEFSVRGSIELQTSPLTRQKSVRFSERSELTHDERLALAETHTNGGFYRIRIRSCAAPTCPYVMAAIRVCELLRSDFKEELKLLLDGAGNLLSLDYRAPLSKRFLSSTSRSTACSSMELSERVVFSSHASLMLSTPSQLIPLQPPPLQKPPPGFQGVPGGRQGKSGEPQPPQGILRKYWYIIVPLVLMLLSGGGEPEGTSASGSRSAPAQGAS